LQAISNYLLSGAVGFGIGVNFCAAPTRSPRPSAWPANGWRSTNSDAMVVTSGCMARDQMIFCLFQNGLQF